jgi:uncharacterized protein
MTDVPRGHVLSIDDGPFDKYVDREALVVGVVTAGRDLVEGVLSLRIPVDGEGITERLSGWIEASRFRPSLRSVMFSGITIAGLSVIDIEDLSRRSGLPVIAVHRKPPRDDEIIVALRTAGFPERIPILERVGPAHIAGRIHFTAAGIRPEDARRIIEAEAGRSNLPEGLRLAHLIAQGIVRGESKGRP